jgi:transcription antitermination factor NusG
MIAHPMSTELVLPTSAELVHVGVPAHPVADQKEPHWFAAYTCANHEKRAAEHFYARELEHFLPLYTSLRKWKDRRVQLEMPLFPGYIFVRIEPAARLRVLEIPGVVRLVGFNGQPYPLPDNEIESLRAAVLQGSRIEPHPYLRVGSSVRIKSGPLAGVQGKLVRKKNIYRVVLSLDLIARSAVVEVDAADVERI